MIDEMRGRLPALAGQLRRQRGNDGGFGPRAGMPSEPEPTALAALALDDGDAVAWLRANQRGDGSFGLELGPVDNDSATALAALALPAGEARDRALAHVEGAKAEKVEDNAAIPLDGGTRGWSWTRGAFGWTEPTARAVLALRILRPGSPAIADGFATLADRQCADGGWNYGNPLVLGEELPAFAQTTAAAMMGLQRADREVVRRGRRALGRLWRDEREGGLSLAMATAALHLHGDPDALDAESSLVDLFARTGFLGDLGALAWAVIATGPGLERLTVTA
jgi:hypothetical protein